MSALPASLPVTLSNDFDLLHRIRSTRIAVPDCALIDAEPDTNSHPLVQYEHETSHLLHCFIITQKLIRAKRLSALVSTLRAAHTPKSG